MGIEHGSESVRNNISLDVWRSRMVSYGGHASSITLLRQFYTDDEFARTKFSSVSPYSDRFNKTGDFMQLDGWAYTYSSHVFRTNYVLLYSEFSFEVQTADCCCEKRAAFEAGLSRAVRTTILHCAWPGHKASCKSARQQRIRGRLVQYGKQPLIRIHAIGILNPCICGSWQQSRRTALRNYPLTPWRTVIYIYRWDFIPDALNIVLCLVHLRPKCANDGSPVKLAVWRRRRSEITVKRRL